MLPFDNAGRISKRTFLVSTTVLFGTVLFSLAARLYIRLRVQKQFSIDDGLVVLGFLLLIAAMGMLYFFVDTMFTSEALLLREGGVELNVDSIQDAFDYQKWAAVTLITTWLIINTVKLSFLSLFRRLVDRMRPMVIYWWFVLVYTIIVGLYGIASYIVPCPTFYNLKALTCFRGPRAGLIFRWSIAQMVLDVLGDILIVVIPIRLIWKIQIRWTQKTALSFSLCLSIAMIAVTLIRVSGIIAGDAIDATWGTYWQYLSAEVGLLMSTATAFRTFFVSRDIRRHEARPHATWYTNLLRRLKSIVLSIRTRSRRQGTKLPSSAGSGERNEDVSGLPQIPQPAMTGIHTFIRGNGRSSWAPSQFMTSLGSQGSMPSQILLSRSVDVDVEVEEGLPRSNDKYSGYHSDVRA